MGNKKRKHSQEFKEEIVQRALSGERAGIRERA
jgi:transposase-like protein